MLPVDVIVVGKALNDSGFTAYDVTEGLGLNTFGFLWPCSGIWASQNTGVSTVWVPIQTSTVNTETCTD